MTKCPNCGGLLTKNDDNDLQCEHCGYIVSNTTTINKNININRINRTIDEADVIRAKNDLKKEKLKLLSIIIHIISGLLLLLLVYYSYTQYKEAHPGFRITMKVNSKDLVNRNYQEAESTLSDHGFTNILCISLNDLTDSNDRNIGKVRNVSIGGKESFSKDGFMTNADTFMSTDQVRIYYHSLEDE